MTVCDTRHLEPCPMCGGAARFEVERRENESEHYTVVQIAIDHGGDCMLAEIMDFKPFAVDVFTLKCLGQEHIDEIERNAASEWNTRPIEDGLRAEIARLREERRWVPVEERLPEVDHEVLLLSPAWVKPGVGLYLNGGWYLADSMHRVDCAITHWMPLPGVKAGDEHHAPGV